MKCEDFSNFQILGFFICVGHSNNLLYSVVLVRSLCFNDTSTRIRIKSYAFTHTHTHTQHVHPSVKGVLQLMVKSDARVSD